VQLSTFIERQVDLLKLDVEGSEEGVLEELVSSSKIRLIDQMMIEYHHHIDENLDTLGEFLKRLEDAGFGYLLNSKKWSFDKRTRGHFQDIGIYAYRKTV